MTIDQAIAMGFPLLTVLMVAATGYVALRWIAPRPDAELAEKEATLPVGSKASVTLSGLAHIDAARRELDQAARDFAQAAE